MFQRFLLRSSATTLVALCRPSQIHPSKIARLTAGIGHRYFSSNSNSKNNPNNSNNGDDNGNDNDEGNKPSIVLLGDGNGSDNIGNGGFLGPGFRTLALPIATSKSSGNIASMKPPDFHPVLPLIIASQKPHFMPYNFIYTISDPDLIEILQYRFKTRQPYVSIFLRRFDLDSKTPVKNIEDLLPFGTLGEIIEIKTVKDGISVLVKGHHRIRLKSFIYKSLVDQINDDEVSDIENKKDSSKPAGGSPKLKISQRQISKMRKSIKQRHKQKHQNDEQGQSPSQSSPLLVDTEKFTDEFNKKDPRTKALAAELVKSLSEIYFFNPLILEYIHMLYPQHQEMFDSPSAICNFVASQFSIVSPEEAYKVFAADHIDDKLELALNLAKKELEMRRIGQQVSKEVDEKIKSHHRKFLLQEQLKEIKKQLGVSKDDKDTIEEKIRSKIADYGDKIPKNVNQVIDEELNKLSVLDSHSSEFSVTRNYLDWMTSLPWGSYDKEILDLNHTGKILDNDHYGMDDVKRRVKEFVAVAKMKKATQGKILCFYGPPGVGKTSIGRSIAAALNRKYFRFSVGGMFDVAEIKGHRRTYVGAMPGKAVQCLKTVKSMNPLILIDEIDKIGRSSGHDGDCSSALLEMLDPEQNASFLDHYLDVPIDLSNVLFICTANVLHTIPEPLKDRMEVIEVNGYTPDEKVKIAQKHLIPKISEESGINKKQVNVSAACLKKIVDEYSRESGVRGLKKSIEKIYRRSAVKLMESETQNNDESKKDKEDTITPSIEINEGNLSEYADRPKYMKDLFYGSDTKHLPAGTVTGLAWTGNGGSTLYIESVIKSKPFMPENDKKDSQNPVGNISTTGNLGKVMKESMEIASTFAQHFINTLDAKNDQLMANNVHLHVPEGAIPKDGPSAGVTITSALVSLALNRPVKSNIAMTGEISLNGRVLAVGGIREKIIAARREGISSVILPAAVKNTFDDMPRSVYEGMDIHFVEHYREVFDILFEC